MSDKRHYVNHTSGAPEPGTPMTRLPAWRATAPWPSGCSSTRSKTEDTVAPRGARRRVLGGDPAAGCDVAPALAIPDDDPAPALHTLAAVEALLLEFEHDLDLSARLREGGERASNNGDRQERRRAAEAGRGHQAGPYPGICASSGSRSQTGIHSGTVRPTDRAFSVTSAEKVCLTSSLSRILSRYFR